MGLMGGGLWYAGSQLQWPCGAGPRFGFPVMLQHLFFLMSLVVLETEEKNPSRQALLLHSRQHLLSLSKTVYGCIIKPLPENQQWVQNLPKKPGKASHPPNFPSPKSPERVNRHFPTLLQVYGEQQEAVLLYIYYIYLLKNIF